MQRVWAPRGAAQTGQNFRNGLGQNFRNPQDLLDTEYFHVVFTVPQAIAEIAAQSNAV
jgi:hypothetical protein